MKKILNIFIVLLIVFVTASCDGVSQKWPVTVKLDKENVLDYIFMDVSYDEVGEDILIETRAASDLYTFSPYSGFYIYLNCDTIFDYEERRNSYKVYVSLNPDGTCEVDDNLNKNAMAMVFNNVEVYGAVDGSVIINGNATNVVNGHVFSPTKNNKIYTMHIAKIFQNQAMKLMVLKIIYIDIIIILIKLVWHFIR